MDAWKVNRTFVLLLLTFSFPTSPSSYQSSWTTAIIYYVWVSQFLTILHAHDPCPPKHLAFTSEAIPKINPDFIIYTKKDRCHIDRSRPLYRVWHDHFQESLVPVGYEICLSVRASCYSFKAITTNNSPRLQILHKISSDNKVSGTSPWPLMTFK
jgi:hypothetical protein